MQLRLSVNRCVAATRRRTGRRELRQQREQILCERRVGRQLGGVQGQASDIEIEAREAIRINDMLRDILAQNTGQDPERIRRDFDRNFYMTAQAAKEYGMIDEILQRGIATP